jgi:extradiol dioxygenase family protein
MPRPVLHLSVPVRDLDEAKHFYVEVLGCRPGRLRADWFDVWFYGMQLTLQFRPDEVRSADEQGVRHFGVALHDQRSFEEVVRRLDAHHVHWLTRPATHQDAELSGKTNIKFADPSGNVIEVKYYDDQTELAETRIS